MTDRLIGTIRAADPALRMPPASADVRESARAMILDSDVGAGGGRSQASPHATRARRGLVLVLVAALLVIVIPGAGAWAYFSYFSDRQTVMDEFHAAQQDMPLPAGTEWVDPNLPDDAVFGSKLGFIAAWGQSTDAWLREWVAAHAAQDGAQERAAITAVERQISLMPIHKDGDPEEAGGFVKESVAFFQGMVDSAKEGDFSGVEEYLQANQ